MQTSKSKFSNQRYFWTIIYERKLRISQNQIRRIELFDDNKLYLHCGCSQRNYIGT